MEAAANIPKWISALRRLDACHEAVEWATQFPTLQEAWDTCERGDWMLWLLGHVAGGEDESPERKRLVMAACACARLALPYAPTGEDRPRLAIETAEAWARGEASPAQLEAAAGAAWAALTAGTAAWVALTAGTAAWAAGAAGTAAWVALTAGTAAWAAGAAGTAAWAAVLRNCAGIVRCHYPLAPTAATEAEAD